MILKTTVGEILEIIDSVWETTDIKLSTISSKILLKGIHKANESWLYVYSTDYDAQCLGKLAVELDENFIYVVDPDELTKGIRSLNHETEVKIAVTGKSNQISAGKVKYKFGVSEIVSNHTTSMAAIPVLPVTDNITRPANLTVGLKACNFAVSKNQALYGVTRTMEITGKDGIITFSASDGSVAAVTEVVSEDVKSGFTFNLSREHIVIFSRLLNVKQAGNVELHTEGSGPLFFKFHDLLFGCGRTTGKLPNIKKLIDSFVIEARAKVKAKELKECLRRAALFTSSLSHNHGIKLECDKTKLTISTTEFEETIDIPFDKESSIIVRKDYLIECISSIKGEELELCFPEQGKALIIKDSFKDDDLTMSSSYILMGMS